MLTESHILDVSHNHPAFFELVLKRPVKNKKLSIYKVYNVPKLRPVAHLGQQGVATKQPTGKNKKLHNFRTRKDKEGGEKERKKGEKIKIKN